jgi:hypothetical protein
MTTWNLQSKPSTNWTAPSQNSIDWTPKAKLSGLPWGEVTMTWGEADFTWEVTGEVIWTPINKP